MRIPLGMELVDDILLVNNACTLSRRRWQLINRRDNSMLTVVNKRYFFMSQAAGETLFIKAMRQDYHGSDDPSGSWVAVLRELAI